MSFTRHVDTPQHLRSEVASDILAVEKEAEGLLDGLLKTGKGDEEGLSDRSLSRLQLLLEASSVAATLNSGWQ